MSNRSTISPSGIWAFGLLLLTLPTGQAVARLAQSSSDHQCFGTVSERAFVYEALERKRSGADQESLVRTLSCIARRATSDGRGTASGAVRAIFGIAGDDRVLRETLLEIITASETPLAAHDTARELLVYVADDETRKAMLKHLAATWPATEHSVGYFQFFTELGDLDFLRWLEGVVIGGEVEYIPRTALEDYAKRIRMQQNPEDIVGYLESIQLQDGCHWRYVWTLHQALRRGMTRERLGSAVLSLIRQHAGKESFLFCDAILVEECQKQGILGDEDAPALHHLAEAMRALNTARKGADPPWPEWAEQRITAKRAEFYRLPPPQKVGE